MCIGGGLDLGIERGQVRVSVHVSVGERLSVCDTHAMVCVFISEWQGGHLQTDFEER